jgi:hypothetical protein
MLKHKTLKWKAALRAAFHFRVLYRKLSQPFEEYTLKSQKLTVRRFAPHR